MEKRGWFVLIIFSIFIFNLNFILALPINNSLHLNIQTTNSTGVITGTFEFTFNISTSSDCTNVVYTNFSTMTTDSRGIISYYLENVTLNYSEQYWLCYYRNDVLINSSLMARTPYSFNAKNVSAEGIINNSNLNLEGYNLTASTGFFKWLGSLVSRITSLFVQSIDFNGTINGSGNITTTQRIGIGTEYPSNELDVRGRGNFSGTIYINNATDISTIITPNASYWNRSLLGVFLQFPADNVGIGTSEPTHELNVEGMVNITSSLFIENDLNISIWKLNISKNWTLDTFTNWNTTWDNNWLIVMLSTNDTLINGSALHIGEQNKTKLHCSNITGAAGDLCTVTGSGGDFSFTDFYSSFVLNSSIINSTYNIGNLYNVTASMISNLSINQLNWTFSLIANTSINQITNTTTQQYIDMINNTRTIGQLYNSTALIITQSVNTTANIQNLLNGTNIKFGNVDFNDGWTNGGVSITGGSIFAQILYVYNISSISISNILTNGSLLPSFDNSFTLGNSTFRWKNLFVSGDIHSNGTIYIKDGMDISLFNDSKINTTAQLALTFNSTYNIGNLYNVTASMISNLSINQLNWTFSLIANTSINQITNTTTQQYIDMINNTRTIGQLYNATASMIANISINQFNWTFSLIANQSFNGRNLTISQVANLSLSQWNATISLIANTSAGQYQTETNLTISSINTTRNIQNLLNTSGILAVYNATYHNYADNVSRNWTLDGYSLFYNKSSNIETGIYNISLGTNNQFNISTRYNTETNEDETLLQSNDSFYFQINNLDGRFTIGNGTNADINSNFFELRTDLKQILTNSINHKIANGSMTIENECGQSNGLNLRTTDDAVGSLYLDCKTNRTWIIQGLGDQTGALKIKDWPHFETLSNFSANGSFVANNTLYVDEGKVGIGTSTPNTNLEVAGIGINSTNITFFNKGALLLTSSTAQYAFITKSFPSAGVRFDVANGYFEFVNINNNTNARIGGGATVNSTWVRSLNINTTSPQSPVYPLEVMGNVSGISIWAYANVSANGFYDRTPYPNSSFNATKGILDIKGKTGTTSIDHKSLPEGVYINITTPIFDENGKKIGEKIDEGRDLSMMVSILTKGLQEILLRIEKLENNIGISKSNPWATDGTNIWNLTANIGLGTDIPSQKLDVRGEGNFSGTIYINNKTNLLPPTCSGTDKLTFDGNKYSCSIDRTGIGTGEKTTIYHFGNYSSILSGRFTNVTELNFTLEPNSFYTFEIKYNQYSYLSTTGVPITIWTNATTINAIAEIPIAADGAAALFQGLITFSQDNVTATSVPISNSSSPAQVTGTIKNDNEAKAWFLFQFRSETGVPVGIVNDKVLIYTRIY